MFLSLPPVVRGALFSFLGFTAWALSDALTKGAGLGGVPTVIIILLSSWSGVAVVLVGLMFSGGLKRLRMKNLKVHAIRSVLTVIVSFASVVAFINLPLTTVYIGIFASPFLIALCGALFMNEPVNRRQIGAIALGFCGVAIALLPELKSGVTGPGDARLGFLALPFFLVFFVANNLYLRILGRTDTPESITIVPFLVRGTVLLPALFFLPLAALPLKPVLLALSVGVCGGIGFLLVTVAYQLAPMAIVASFHYTQLVSGAVLGYLFWRQSPSPWVWGGGAVIVLSGLMMAQEARRRHRAEPPLIEET